MCIYIYIYTPVTYIYKYVIPSSPTHLSHPHPSPSFLSYRGSISSTQLQYCLTMQHCSGTWCSEMRHENHSWWPCGISRGILGKRLISGVVLDLLGYCWGSMELMKLMQIASNFKTYYLVDNILFCIQCFWSRSEWGQINTGMKTWYYILDDSSDQFNQCGRYCTLRPNIIAQLVNLTRLVPPQPFFTVQSTFACTQHVQSWTGLSIMCDELGCLRSSTLSLTLTKT